LSPKIERTRHYRLTATRLRNLAESAQFPEVKDELLWLAEGYERLARAPEVRRLVDGHRVLEIDDLLDSADPAEMTIAAQQ
jgi:hypothetical protein